MGKVGLTVTYPATESDALEDIVPIGVVVPLDAMSITEDKDSQ
jgi:hypothetical protein